MSDSESVAVRPCNRPDLKCTRCSSQSENTTQTQKLQQFVCAQIHIRNPIHTESKKLLAKFINICTTYLSVGQQSNVTKISHKV